MFSPVYTYIIKKNNFQTTSKNCPLYNGRRDEIRTHDPYVPNVVLYQAEPPSDNEDIISKS